MLTIQTWRFLTLGGLLSLVVMSLTGCIGSSSASKPVPPSLPEVVYSTPLVRDLAEFDEFTGRTEASLSIDIRSRVTGYLEKAPFKEGEDVKKGQLLFEIDRRPYQAELDRALAQERQAAATMSRLSNEYQRARALVRSRAISEEELDRIAGSLAEADAADQAARAAIRTAKLNLDFTRITAPIDGRISRRNCDPGNLIKADDTILTSLVVLDPIHAYFDVDERTVLRLRRLVNSGKTTLSRQESIPVQLGLADEEGFSLSGHIDFVDNRLDPNTGTLRIRAVIDNPHLLLSPGMFIRLRLPVSATQRCILVPEESLVTDQGQKMVYVLDDQDQVAYRRVTVGQETEGFRVIRTGVSPGDRVIVRGQQRVRPGIKVVPRASEQPAHVATPVAAIPPAL